MSAAEHDELLEQAQDLLAAARARRRGCRRCGLLSRHLGLGAAPAGQDRGDRARREPATSGLRVFVGRCSASVSASAVDPAAFARLAEQAVAMARVVPEDPYAGLPEAPPPMDASAPDLDDPAEPALALLIARAAAAEEAALAVPGITNSEGAEASWSRSDCAARHQPGFLRRCSPRTYHGVSATALAGAGTDMQRDYDYSSAVHGEDLEDPAAIGRPRGGTGGGAAEPDPAEDRAAAGGVRPARGGQLPRPSRRRHQRGVDRARHLLPEGQARPADLRPRHHHHRRPAAPCAACARARSTARACPAPCAASSRTAC